MFKSKLCFLAANVKNLGDYTILIQTMLNKSGADTFAGKVLPKHFIKFKIVGKYSCCAHFLFVILILIDSCELGPSEVIK